MTRNTPLRSLSDLPRDLIKQPFLDWNIEQLRDDIMRGATETLANWLDASLRELHREGVNQDDVQITNRGGRTLIRVRGVDRFEFKIKFSYERS